MRRREGCVCERERIRKRVRDGGMYIYYHHRRTERGRERGG